MVKKKNFWKILGPGVITGAADDDPSGIATYSQSGAQFGYSQLWVALLILPFMVAIQEYLMAQLGLPYEVVLKCTADIGKPNARGVDINVWLPGQDKYRETHTADYMTDYQARRLQTRVRRNSGETQLVHTNDATAFSQRPLIAILENFQQKDGSIKVPKVLHKFGAPKVIKKI